MALKSCEFSKYGYSNTWNSAYKIEGSITVNALADGSMLAGNSLNCFYVFLPWVDGGGRTPSLQNVPSWITSELIGSNNLGSWRTEVEVGEGNYETYYIYYGYNIYKLTVGSNANSTSERSLTLNLRFPVSEFHEVTASDYYITTDWNIVTVDVKLAGAESHDDPSSDDLLKLKYGYSNDLDNAVAIESSFSLDIKISANGNPKASSAPYFYLFVPYFKGTGSYPQFNNTPSFVSYIKEGELPTGNVTEYAIQGYGDVVPYQTHYGYYIYKVTITENSSTSSRAGTFSIRYINNITGPEYPNPPAWAYATYTTKEISFTLTLEGIESHDEPTTDNNYYYRVDTVLTNYDAPLSQYTNIKGIPQSISDSYSYKSSDEQNVNRFKYLYVRSVDEAALTLSIVSNSEWARFVLVHTEATLNLTVYEIKVDTNPGEFSRSAILSLQYRGSNIINLYLSLYGTSSGDNPHIDPDLPSDADLAEDKYWEGEGTTGSFIITDTNEGAIIDSTQLLFKSNYANIYNTIEQKDGTLFLGNYINENTINNVHDVMNAYIGTDKILVAEGLRKVPVNRSGSSNYTYVPDMTQNSLQKRLFKYGETYALGLVFVYKTGTWSSVYYLGEDKGRWNIIDASLEPVLILDNGNIYYNKPVRYCVLSLDVTNALAAMGVIAVIPVYAVKNSHRIMCQGFLSPTLQSSTRLNGESIEALYSWFYRTRFKYTIPEYLDNGTLGSHELKEILNLDADINSPQDYNAWLVNRQICSLNTPEVEVDEVLSDAMLSNASCRSVRNYSLSTVKDLATNIIPCIYTNNITLTTNGKYLKSYFSAANVFGDSQNPTPISSVKDRRVITGYFWHGFVNKGYKSTDGTLLDESNKEENYNWYFVYPWLRATIGGEGPTSLITNKRLFNSIYTEGLHVINVPELKLRGVVDAAIYRDFDTASIIRVGDNIYLGNTDYIAVTELANAYKAWTKGELGSNYPYAHEDDGNYAGYDTLGRITDPISIKYKTAPHIIIKFDGNVVFDDTLTALYCVELLNGSMDYKTGILDLLGYQWIKCGDLKRILPTDLTIILFEEGDYFFGRFDSLRTYCYTEEDVNSVVETVSGMLCSRVNLDSRCDRNRGAATPTVTPENFNIFNPVYNQLNNYFTFSYINQGDIIYKRKYGNSIQWSLTKEYSADVDNWCNIQDINTLDFDGDKGEIQSITKLGNNLIVFLDTGISQIQYNEKTLIATELGVPIEIGNSNKVDGKYYLYDNIGCQYKGSISKSPNGIYFADSINRTLYLLGLDSSIKDLCTIGGMKSWGLANLDRTWWSYYDINSQEVLFTNNVESLAFSDSYLRFNSFIGYGGIRWNFRANDRTVQICPTNFTLVISTSSPNVNSSIRMPDVTKALGNVTNTFWKKNSKDATEFFGNYSPIEIQLMCNPEPTIDKTFCVVEYRMDCFDPNGCYLPETSFDIFRAWNEYQDTLENSLRYRDGQTGPVYSTVYSTKLRKKFRIWRIEIPRVYYGNALYVPGSYQSTPNLNLIIPVQTDIVGQSSGRLSMDRLRNPWCNLYFKFDTSRANKVIFNDLIVQYFK